MKIESVREESFRPYGRIVAGYEVGELLEELKKISLPQNGTEYVASDARLEQLTIFGELQSREYGGMPIQLGYCNGRNSRLDALEYHRSSELNLAADDLILLLGKRQDIDPETFAYDTSNVKAFLVPAGTMVELYATTLHYAPCQTAGTGFRDAVVLPRGTNFPLGRRTGEAGEERLLFANNKWLLAHPESGLEKDGAWMGLKGSNVSV